MSKFAQFDSTAAAPQPVIGWYDTDLLNYPSLPPATDLLELSDAQWSARNETPFVDGNILVGYSAAQLLAQAQTAQIAILTAARNAAMLAPVSYKTAAGTTALFATTPEATGYLQGVIDAGSAAWTANLWLSNAGTPITPFTFADVQGLAAAIEAVETPEYQELLKLIGEVMAATTVSASQGVTWA